MTPAPLEVEVDGSPALCYALQQAAVRWLRGVKLHNRGDRQLRALQVTVALEPALPQPWTIGVDELPAGGSVELPAPDLPLAAAAFVNLVERERADLQVTVRAEGAQIATHHAPIDLLAYNEWPGFESHPELLAAFVSPNHPGLPPLLHAAAARLAAATGRAALDGYQSRDPARVRAILAAVHEAVAAHGITYAAPPPSFERRGQKIRTPDQVLGDRLGTCLDLAVLYAALLEHAGLSPLVILAADHAFAGVWCQDTPLPAAALGPAVELRKRLELGALAVVECTAACATSSQPFAAAAAAAAARLRDDSRFAVAIDVAAARRAGIRPLPMRTAAFAPLLSPSGPPAAVAAGIGSAAGRPDGGERWAGAPPAVPAAEAPPPPPAPPRDRLEHWRERLLDLSMWNRLLNFVPTKRTIPLCAPDLAALEDRLQQGSSLRVLARPELGQHREQPRDLDLASQRLGYDVVQSYLAEELRAGRLHADLDPEALDERLVEIYRRARISIDESGANTLYLAVGFLRWFETPDSQQPRRSPLLLLPLLIERTSVRDGFRLRLDDAEPCINQTLLLMLQRDFALRTPFADGLPEDERGVDVGAVLDGFRAVVLSMPRWEVEAVACIGFFSFTKYLMWLDLADRDELLASPVLRHLVESPGGELPQQAPQYSRDDLDDLDPSAVFCPMDADSSQLAAVLEGAGGRSFVLEGPPGTGKSQTIANLIAQALANGRRVLFVAEKRAALEVVQRRLAAVGLGPFCLELHSQKCAPKAVLGQLGSALELGQRRAPADWQRVAGELQAERDRLNRFVRALHRRREHGFSVHDAMARLVALRGVPRVPLPDLLPRGPAGVESARAAVAALAVAGGALPVPMQSAWWGVCRTDWTPAVSRDAGPLVERLGRAAAALAAAVAPVAAALALDLGGRGAPHAAGPSRVQLDALLGLVRLLRAPSRPPAPLLRAPDLPAVGRELEIAAAAGRQRDALWAPLAARWRPELLTAAAPDLAGIAATLRLHAGSFFLWRWLRLRRPRALLAPLARGPLGRTRAVQCDLEIALRAREEQRRLDGCAAAAAALGSSWCDGQADWDQVDAWRNWCTEALQLLARLAPAPSAPAPAAVAALAAQLDALAAGHGIGVLLDALQSAHDEFVAELAAARQHLALDDEQAFGAAGAAGWLGAVAARSALWGVALPRLRDHCAWRAAADAAAMAGVAPLVAAHAAGELAAEALVPAFERALCEGWLDELHRQEPELARFRGRDHEAAIARFAALDQRAIELAAQVVVARLAARLPVLRDTQVASSELGVLERELKKQRRHKPVRRLLAEIPGLWPRLAPCVLMSPLSIAQFLGRDAPRFDLVVFDEASQIPMWDAVGAIGRGSALVVVGDSRQLPPTSFFQREAQGDDIENDAIPEDLESVLDECGAAGLPRLHLDWHYRSRHESLIAFSNHHYYRNRLLTFPAPQRAAAGAGVRCVRVPGVYDRAGSQQNRIEAEALVAEVLDRLRDAQRARQSIGVVTFSRAQQVLIEDLLDRARRDDPALEPAFGGVPEPVFVKNLENVQGDERDVILFSICYGPDAAGRIHENYGPLNLEGGERRLNVAITRARRELVVFTSLGPEQVGNRSQSLGARHLRVFLDYALRGEAALAAAVAADPSGAVESPFEAAVRDALAARGHEVHAQIGCSGYRIDLAVVDPAAAGRYLLGIECDGRSYHAAATARDRDRLRAAVLRGLGWQLVRVWSTDFWQDPEGEIDRLEQAIAAARAAPPAAAPPDPVAAAAPPAGPAPAAAAAGGIAGGDPDGPRRYTSAALPAAGTGQDFNAPAALAAIAAQARALLAGEGPIAFDRLVGAIASRWGLARITERVRERVRAALPAGAHEHRGTWWRDAAQRDGFRGFRVPAGDAGHRDAGELPLVEVENAMLWLLRQHATLAEDDLAREAARLFGIQRLGNVVREVMAQCVAGLEADGRVQRDGALLRAV